MKRSSSRCRTRDATECQARTQGRPKQAGLVVAPIKVKGRISITCVPRRGTLPDDDVEFVVLERGVEFLFQQPAACDESRRGKAPGARAIGQDGGEVALDLRGGAGGLLEAHVEFIGNDGGKSGFAQAWRPEEKNVIERLARAICGFKRDGKLPFGLGLADELTQPAGAQFEFKAPALRRRGRR